jgi:VanZ family protein
VARWLAVAAWMGAIFALSSVSGLRVSQDAEVDRPLRTLAHLAAFGLLGGLVLYALCANARPSIARAVVAMAITTLYAIGDELHQSLVPDRSGRVQDVAIDALGALAGLAVAWLVLRRGAGPPKATPSGSGPSGSGPSGSGPSGDGATDPGAS